MKKKQKYDLKNYNIRANRKIGGWTLTKKIGTGGNGEVWTCRNAEGGEYAIKFLKSSSSIGYKRFFDEVVFMENYRTIEGVMPVIDKYIPEYNKRHDIVKLPFYYVMPLAESAEERILKSKMSVDEKIIIIQELLVMLKSLHAIDVAHRDIKPANILFHNGKYVLSDFGLVFFSSKTSKTPPNAKLGAKWTISPQMERNAVSADKFKADVYSMAKTIWMILTGNMSSFEGQYIPNSIVSLHQYLPNDRYLYPLEKLLVKCTDNSEDMRPNAIELEQEFADWIEINNDWRRENLLQWQEVQEKLFPTVVPTHAEWHSINDIVYVLRMLGKYNSQNHTFFPNGGGLDLTGAELSNEVGCIELHCDGLIYVVKPKKLSFEFINSEIEWSYFSLETGLLDAITPNYSKDYYDEELYEISPSNYHYSLENILEEGRDKIYPRSVTRYLRGSFVMFHKDSIYNNSISQYRGEHEKIGLQQFRVSISRYADTYKGQNMLTMTAEKS